MQVKVLNDCFVDATLRKKGETFEYRGPKNEHLEPVKKSKEDPEQAGTVEDSDK